MPSVRRQVDRHGLRVCVYSTARDTLEDLIQREDRAVRGFHVAVKALRVQEIEAALDHRELADEGHDHAGPCALVTRDLRLLLQLPLAHHLGAARSLLGLLRGFPIDGFARVCHLGAVHQIRPVVVPELQVAPPIGPLPATDTTQDRPEPQLDLGAPIVQHLLSIRIGLHHLPEHVGLVPLRIGQDDVVHQHVDTLGQRRQVKLVVLLAPIRVRPPEGGAHEEVDELVEGELHVRSDLFFLEHALLPWWTTSRPPAAR